MKTNQISKLILIIFLTIPMLAGAQSLKFGPMGGLNFSTYRGDNTDNAVLKTGFHIGVAAEFKLDKIGVESGIYYTSKGGKYSESGTLPVLGTPWSNETTISTTFLEIPVLAKIYGPLGLNIFAGPQLSVVLDNKSEVVTTLGTTTNTQNFTGTEGLNTTDLSLVAGLGIDLPGGLCARASYDLGFLPAFKSDNSNQEDPKTYMTTIKISVGFKF